MYARLLRYESRLETAYNNRMTSNLVRRPTTDVSLAPAECAKCESTHITLRSSVYALRTAHELLVRTRYCSSTHCKNSGNTTLPGSPSPSRRFRYRYLVPGTTVPGNVRVSCHYVSSAGVQHLDKGRTPIDNFTLCCTSTSTYTVVLA